LAVIHVLWPLGINQAAEKSEMKCSRTEWNGLCKCLPSWAGLSRSARCFGPRPGERPGQKSPDPTALRGVTCTHLWFKWSGVEWAWPPTGSHEYPPPDRPIGMPMRQAHVLYANYLLGIGRGLVEVRNRPRRTTLGY